MRFGAKGVKGEAERAELVFAFLEEMVERDYEEGIRVLVMMLFRAIELAGLGGELEDALTDVWDYFGYGNDN